MLGATARLTVSLIGGRHVLTLLATDNFNQTATDTVIVDVLLSVAGEGSTGPAGPPDRGGQQVRKALSDRRAIPARPVLRVPPSDLSGPRDRLVCGDQWDPQDLIGGPGPQGAQGVKGDGETREQSVEGARSGPSGPPGQSDRQDRGDYREFPG